MAKEQTVRVLIDADERWPEMAIRELGDREPGKYETAYEIPAELLAAWREGNRKSADAEDAILKYLGVESVLDLDG